MGLCAGDRVLVLLPGTGDVWSGTVKDPTDLDTWPTWRGEYHPSPPGGHGDVLVRYDGWPDDVWHTVATVHRIDQMNGVCRHDLPIGRCAYCDAKSVEVWR